MGAGLEHIGFGRYALRAGPRFENYGDLYSCSGTVKPKRWFDMFLRWFGCGSCEVIAFTRRDDDKSNTMKIGRSVFKRLNEVGYCHLTWDRISESCQKRHVEI